MKFMMVVKASKDSESGTMPKEQMDQMFAAMKTYNEVLKNAGVLLSVGGLHPSSEGIRINFPVPGEPPTVTDGPFGEVNELIAGYWFIDVKSREEAIEWAKRAPDPHGLGEGQIELRQVAEN
ncbi:YciI family protein [Virgibacillus flavescens]|uniref:YciI family protein n=1 Tax=Virgibacillus flavescens TaxID=1611422 RepID=UPI003D347E46